MVLDVTNAYSAFCADYFARDIDACARWFTDDVVFALYVDRELVPFGGVSIGKAALRRRWDMIVDMFDLLQFDLVSVVQEGDRCRGLVAYHFRHRATGEDIAGQMRHVIQMRGNLIARADEHHDRTRVEAFFRLIQSLEPKA